MFAGGAAIGQLFHGSVTDRFGRRGTLAFGILLSVLVSILVAGKFGGLGDHVYTGVTYARVTNGLASAFPGTPGAKFGLAGTNTSVDTASWMSGFRLKI
jgi:hypothetical protein